MPGPCYIPCQNGGMLFLGGAIIGDLFVFCISVCYFLIFSQWAYIKLYMKIYLYEGKEISIVVTIDQSSISYKYWFKVQAPLAEKCRELLENCEYVSLYIST